MSILDKRMDLAGHEINPGQEAQRTMALILVITGEGRMNAEFRRQVRRRRTDRLHAGFFIIRDDSHRIRDDSHRVAWHVGLFQNLDLPVDAEDVRHLFFEFRIAALQVYPVHVTTRKSLGDITRKLSVTELRSCAQLRGTFSRRNSSVASANWVHVA